MIRSRLAALRDNNDTYNFLQRNIVELAKYGYDFCDLHNPFHTDLLETLMALGSSAPNWGIFLQHTSDITDTCLDKLRPPPSRETKARITAGY